ncbi:MAG: substrate-binding domain-containing protein, partial [Pedosphaera sp.]|nr:substrate-binding domain-containing protein [Pedosphaera sp.]
EFLNSVATKIPLITHDSDAPGSNRLLYIGMDNYKAGRMCGQLVKRALPDGGAVMLFIGRLEQDNSKHRRQGVIDELLDRPRPDTLDKVAYDPVADVIKGERFQILGTLTDQGKPEAAKQKAADAINAYVEMKAMVGLFEYNPPACYQALKQAGKLGEIKLIGFDENDVTLQGIKDGTIIGTGVQNPYEYGYQSVKVLKDLLEGREPASDFIDIPPRMITKENVDEYWADLKAKMAGGEKPARQDGKPSFAFVSNGVASFWTIASVGVNKAGADLGVNTEVLMPAEGISDQKRIIEDLLTKGIDGIAVSPIDPVNQTELLNQAAKKTTLITHDSDAPDADRLVYIGMSNYDAGRLCGKLVKEALPKGGKIMIFIGRLEQDNAKLRRQGVIDEVLGRDHNPKRYDAPGKVLRGKVQ